MSSLVSIKISDILISIHGDIPQSGRHIPSAYQPFISCGLADISLRLRRGTVNLRSMRKVFDSSPIWSLYRADDLSIFVIYEEMPEQTMILVYPPRLKTADLYFPDASGRLYYPLFGPAMELLMINYLVGRAGAIIHGCGIARNDSGFLFVGESGAGKSTLANLWSRERGADVLSDDRTVVRCVDGEFRMYGTPWHGEAKFGFPRGVKLEKIYFLRHNEQNVIQPLTRAESVLKMLQCSFPPYWDAAGMQITMELFERLVTCVSCYELAFRPDESAIQFVASFAQ
jgi:hypothetical protein